MTPPPVAVGLALCDYVIIEEGTHKVSPIGIFNRLYGEHFPWVAARFSVFATLTDGLGLARIQLVVTRLDTNEEVYSRGGSIYFPDRLAVVNYRIPVKACLFPTPAWYLFTVLVDNDWVAQRRLEVVSRGTQQ